MINILVIVPYPELLEEAAGIVRREASQGVRCELVHAYGTGLDAGLFAGRDIVLARGLTRQAVAARFPGLTVLELAVGDWDVLQAIAECRRIHSAEKIAVLTPAPADFDATAMGRFAKVAIRHFKIRDEKQIRSALEKAKGQNCAAVVGGLTAINMANERGWKTAFIRTSSGALRRSIQEAMNTARVMRDERAKHAVSRAILQNAGEAVLYFDQKGKLTQFNQTAEEILGPCLSAEPGSPVEQVFSDSGLRSAVRALRTERGLLREIAGQLLLADIVPVRLEDEDIGVVCTLRRAGEIQAAETRIRSELSRKGLVARYSFRDIVHADPVLASAIATARKYAAVDANVLITGETGTGKELFAQSIHNAGPRRRRPFVALNCASFPENLLESELFGYAPGAFSGAARGGKTGLFELAHGGTMFLDEIGEMPLSLQATLLRALQEGEIRKIGGDQVIPVDVRVIAATNKDLRRRVRDGAFRMDLLYRLDVLSLRVPPLRERPQDIPHVARHYFAHYCEQYRRPASPLGTDALAAFAAHDWPGNIRELKNVCERLAVLGGDGAIDRAAAERVLALSAAPLSEFGPGGEASGETAAATAAAAALPAPGRIPTDGRELEMAELVNLSKTLRLRREDIAGLLGISRTTLWRRLRRDS